MAARLYRHGRLHTPYEEYSVKTFRFGMTAVAVLSAVTLTAISSSTNADARPYGHHHGGYHRGGVGLAVGAGLLGGLAVAGAYPYASGRCWLERRPFYDRYGNQRWRRVQICN